MTRTRFKLDPLHSRKVWIKGTDTCGDPLFEIHAPCDRTVGADSYLLLYIDPSWRATRTQKQRATWYKFPTYRAAQLHARGLV
jgi:hypothetical protein